MKRALSYLSLFTSSATLICCALPALLVTLGLGASLAGLLSSYPELIWFSENKMTVFVVAGALLAGAGYLQFGRAMACPVEGGEACESLRGASFWIYVVSVVVFGVGFFFAFVAEYLL